MPSDLDDAVDHEDGQQHRSRARSHTVGPRPVVDHEDAEVEQTTDHESALLEKLADSTGLPSDVHPGAPLTED